MRPVGVKVKAASKKVGKIVNLEDCFNDITRTLLRLLETPLTLIMIAAVGIICITHSDDLSDGFLKKLIEDHPESGLLKFIKAHFKQFLGALIFSCVIVDLPKSANRLLASGAAAFWVFSLPPYNVYQYAVHALLMHSYFRVYLRKSKVVILTICIVVFLFGHQYLGTFGHPKLTTTLTTKAIDPEAAAPHTNSGRNVNAGK